MTLSCVYQRGGSSPPVSSGSLWHQQTDNQSGPVCVEGKRILTLYHRMEFAAMPKTLHKKHQCCFLFNTKKLYIWH